jgi:hypothetical protein
MVHGVFGIMRNLKVVGFSGALHSGKSTAANLMVKMGFTKFSFAGPLKKMCIAGGLSEDQIYGSLEDKNRPFYFPPDFTTKSNMLKTISADIFYELGIDLDHAFVLLDVIFPQNHSYTTTGRKVMQLLGTEWGRSLHPELWTTMWRHEVESVLSVGGKAVVDDVRFSNEGDIMHTYHPRNIIEIQCPIAVKDVGIAGHASEQVLPGDVVLYNTKRNTAELWERLEEALEDLEGSA